MAARAKLTALPLARKSPRTRADAPVEVEARVGIAIRLTQDVRRELKLLAARRDTSVQALIEEAVNEMIRRKEK